MGAPATNDRAFGHGVYEKPIVVGIAKLKGGHMPDHSQFVI